MLTRSEIAALADSMRALLADEDTQLTATTRAHWQGALAALEVVLDQTSTQIDADVASQIRQSL